MRTFQILPLPPSTVNSRFILVSFGSISKGDLIPIDKLKILFSAFAKFPQFTIVWQLDAPRDYFEPAILKSFNWKILPAHIHIFTWVPLRTLLTDPRVDLLVSHGGVTTRSEASNAAVPVLGIALQADQGYNLQRLVEKGVGEFVRISKLNEQNFYEKLSKMIRDNKK